MAAAMFGRIKAGTAVTCEPVLTEVFFLASRVPGATERLMEFLALGLVRIGFLLRDEEAAVFRLMRRYASVPMSLADACLVRLSELHPQARVVTFDSDFELYRRNRNQVIPLFGR
jgi:uncharacterized protein